MFDWLPTIALVLLLADIILIIGSVVIAVRTYLDDIEGTFLT